MLPTIILTLIQHNNIHLLQKLLATFCPFDFSSAFAPDSIHNQTASSPPTKMKTFRNWADPYTLCQCQISFGPFDSVQMRLGGTWLHIFESTFNPTVKIDDMLLKYLRNIWDSFPCTSLCWQPLRPRHRRVPPHFICCCSVFVLSGLISDPNVNVAC